MEGRRTDSFGEFLALFIRARNAGHIIQSSDDPKKRTLGFYDVATGIRTYIPLYRVVDRPEWWSDEYPEDKVTAALGINAKGAGELIQTPQGRAKLMTLTPTGEV